MTLINKKPTLITLTKNPELEIYITMIEHLFNIKLDHVSIKQKTHLDYN